jgi:putative ABC transport system ATP-binding protein
MLLRDVMDFAAHKVLEVKNLSKVYRMGEVSVQAVKGANFDVYEGEFIVVLGPSGSGKSTILNIIGGIDSVTDGEIFYRGDPLHKANDAKLTQYRRNSIGFVFQFYNLIPNLTARENILLASELSKSPIPVDELLEKIDLSDRAGHFPSKMSGGQQQRVAIARAVAKNPDILLCDEPTGALDFSTGVQVLKILRDFNRDYKKTVIIITHNAGIAEMADRVFYIKDGTVEKIVENDNPASPEDVGW